MTQVFWDVAFVLGWAAYGPPVSQRPQAAWKDTRISDVTRRLWTSLLLNPHKTRCLHINFRHLVSLTNARVKICFSGTATRKCTARVRWLWLSPSQPVFRVRGWARPKGLAVAGICVWTHLLALGKAAYSVPCSLEGTCVRYFRKQHRMSEDVSRQCRYGNLQSRTGLT
jgi:hypothetical protein